ncbi:SDR family NAD(P)-dependent oxidoreductase [Nonomuraea sp. NPDC004580]|uniref:SDR family NAD(P)-dependent oxidoreductase n=1 Tax=Nonomuraea sp. NPDC004580 TaxID=3154552 RepID=UPI0033A34C3D
MRKTAVVIGAGPGLGMSMAHRFGREGHAVGLISRSPDRHPAYVAALAEAGVEAAAFAADVYDRERVLAALDEITARFGPIDLLYYGPGATDVSRVPEPITETTSDDVRQAMAIAYAAVDVTGHVLPGMVERGEGGLLYAGGLSAVLPMPPLGALAPAAAALRTYALTLNAALAAQGVYAGSLTIGGVVERGDIHRQIAAAPERFGGLSGHTLDPDVIAGVAWELFTKRDRAEETFNAL